MRVPLLLALFAVLAGAGCDAAPADPTTGMVVLHASVDARRSSTSIAALEAPLPAAPDDARSYTALVARAAQESGAPAARVVIRDLSLVICDQDFAGGIDELFAGDVEVRLQPTGGAPSLLVATIPADTVQRAGAGLVVDDATFDTDTLSAADRAAVLAGDFTVTVAGPAGPAFAARRPTLEIAVPMVFEVYP